MNEFRKIINDICEEQGKLYEGLIVSHPIENAISVLRAKNYTTSYEKGSNEFFVTVGFDDDLDIAEDELSELLSITNNLGWYPANMGYGKEFNNIIKWDRYQLNFELLIQQKHTKIKFLFEPKYDTRVLSHERYLYHLTPSVYVKKILKMGLIPKSFSKKAYHPDRIYLGKTPESTDILIPAFRRSTGIDDWTVLKIDTHPIEHYLQLYKDQNFKEQGYYTLNTITPLCITVYDKKEIHRNNIATRIDNRDHSMKRGVKKKPGDKTPNYEY
jgi:hypothetical protein